MNDPNSIKNQYLGSIWYENKLFFSLFFIWVLVGGVLLSMFSRETLFFFVNKNNSETLDYIMTILSGYGRGDCIPIILLSLLLVEGCRNKHYLFTSIVGGALLTSIIAGAKRYFDCSRPLVEYGIERVHTVVWLGNAYQNSFPSGHTLGAFGMFLILTFYLPNRLKNWSILFFLLALGCGYSRMYLGQHYFKDVYVGSILGVFIVTSVYAMSNYLYLTLKSNASS